MRKTISLLMLAFTSLSGCAQIESRIKINAITPSENTGQDYSNWLNDDLNKLIPNNWSSTNFRYIDVTLRLEKKSNISRISLYDYEGDFTDNPATVYALNGLQKTLLGTFTGDRYKMFVDLKPDRPVLAEALVIHKYCNNIPEKIFLYGMPSGEITPADSVPTAIITFGNLPNKKVGDTPFKLTATSTNTRVPITFSSNNPSVISVNNVNGSWTANVKNTGSVIITASQAGGSDFKAAANVLRYLTISPSGSVTVINGKIPIDPKRWFQLTNATNGLNGLFDGVTNVEVHTGWGKILENYDSYYPVLDGEMIDISGIRMYDGEGINTTQPMTLSVINNSGQKIAVMTFTGTSYNSWTGPDPGYPSRFNLPITFGNIKYLVINSWNFFPTEIELIGNYTAGKATTPVIKKTFPFRQFSGINGFEWNFEAPNSPGQVDKQLFKAAKAFSGFRHYIDWEKLESSPGSYTYNPTLSGGWNYDALYDSCKAAGIEVLACLKTLPGWMLNTYPSDQRDMENVPVKFGKDYSNPNSYKEQARLAFQYTSRYGNNKAVDRSLLKVNNTPRWTGDNVNTIKVGLGTVRYIECDNERDKWWKGRKAYQTAYEYAANLSAFYDGHKNTMGAGVGVKNADPGMKVVMAGTALASTDYLKGMIDWCRQHRGYKSDGTVNLCWDIINYHYYSNDSWSSQNGNATRGAAPELSGTAQVAAEFIQAAHLYANDMPVWVTEAGYDANQGSAFKAIPIKNKTALETQADWILRSALLYARSGIERVFFYEMYDDNLWSSQQFSSSGLLNNDKTRKPAADYLYQANKLIGQYNYQETMNTDPIVDRYTFNNNTAYVVLVPDERGRTVEYTMDLNSANWAKIYTPKAGSDTMDFKIVPVTNGHLTITVTETPQFIIPVENTTGTLFSKNNSKATGALQDNAAIFFEDNQAFGQSVQVYPNPISDLMNFTISNQSSRQISLKVVEEGTGIVFKNIRFDKPSKYFRKSINVNTLPTGSYLIEIRQGNNRVIKRFLKI